jgi:hypothetical protein
LVVGLPAEPAFELGRVRRGLRDDRRLVVVPLEEGLFVSHGVDEVAVRAGHSSGSFTLDRYGHLYPEADAALRDRLDAFFAAPAEWDTKAW